MKKRILLLEDDMNLGLILSEQLETNGYEVKLCRNGVEGSNEYAASKYDICIVDIMMPKKDGFTFVRELRKTDQKIPVIFLTAKSLKEDRIEGFKIGADDYITKPFSFEELLLRIKAILRRVNDVPSQEVVEFNIGKYIFNWEKQTLKSGNLKEVLTSRESDLLKILCLNMNKIIEREIVLKNIWGDDTYFNARSMDVYISKIRKFLKDDPDVILQNIHGKGYKLIIAQK
jgi:DNA-binding response OmpR family regulator